MSRRESRQTKDGVLCRTRRECDRGRRLNSSSTKELEEEEGMEAQARSPGEKGARGRQPDVPEEDAIVVDVRMAALLDVPETRPEWGQIVSRHAAANVSDTGGRMRRMREACEERSSAL
jgi:hypothetical protein